MKSIVAIVALLGMLLTLVLGVGETEVVSVDDASVLSALDYAFSQAYDRVNKRARNYFNSNVASYQVVHATKQLVNGYKYEPLTHSTSLWQHTKRLDSPHDLLC